MKTIKIKIPPREIQLAALIILLLLINVPRAFALASNNIPLDSPIYLYIEKLAGFGLIDSDVKGIRPYSRAEAARLYLEAEDHLKRLDSAAPPLAADLMQRLGELLPREIALRQTPGEAPKADYELFSRARLRYVFLDGTARDFNRDVIDAGHQSAFGFLGGDLRPFGPIVDHTTGSEGTPLFENNEGVTYRRGSNADLRFDMEGYAGTKVSALVEPLLLARSGDASLQLEKVYLKLGGGGAELEIGRDANWFGPGFRGATTLTNNAKNFDLVKLSSPEPLDVAWVKRFLGDVKYALFVSRFDATNEGTADYRRPWMLGAKIAVKPRPWWEIGGNFVRQTGGPGFTGSSDSILGGGNNDHSNTIAGFDLRFRIASLRDTEFFGEYAGEDNAGGVWPIVESYVAGFFIPRLTDDGRNDLRFEYYWGSVMAYSDWQFPAGYVYHGMTPGHSQGTAAQDFFVRYGHWFSPRNNLALEYFHTDRGKQGKMPGQSAEYKNSWRAQWSVPVYRDLDLSALYGWERIGNVNLVPGTKRTNQLVKIDLSYRY